MANERSSNRMPEYARLIHTLDFSDTTRLHMDGAGRDSDDLMASRQLELGAEPAQLSDESFELTAVVAAIEAQFRLGYALPVSVSGGAPQTESGRKSWILDNAEFRENPVRNIFDVIGKKYDPHYIGETVDISLAVDHLSRSVNGLQINITPTSDVLSVSIKFKASENWGFTHDKTSELDAFAELFSNILKDLVNDPQTSPKEAQGLGEAAREFVLGPLAGQADKDHQFQPVHEMIEHSINQYSEEIAYRFGEQHLSFERFGRLTNALTQKLAMQGVRKGVVVPTLITNSLEMPVAYLALMKRGAAFVPLDTDWPLDRLVQTLEQLSSPVILCEEGVVLPTDFEDRRLTIRLDELTETTKAPVVEVGPMDSVFGFFTSGTTGKPKCAINNHGALSNRFTAMTHYLGAKPGPVLQNTRYIFDSSIGHLFLPLTMGRSVIIPEQKSLLDLHYTLALIEKYQVTMTDFVPSVLNQLINLAEHNSAIRAQLGSLRQLIVGGEEITPNMVHKLRAIMPDQFRVSNAYGPTETAIGMAYHPVRDSDGMHIPLGRPLDNCYVVIVDNELNALPCGACGELLIGGICVGNGYLNNEARTAEVFINNPFSEIPGPTLYRTGDRGYYDSKGNLHFLGRLDFQVKIGGVRIELGEIETVAEEFATVNQAKAILSQGAIQQSLALYVAVTDSHDHEAFCQHLDKYLPQKHRPKHIFPLASMPVANSGKLDHKALQSSLREYLEDLSKATIAESHSGATIEVVHGAVRKSLQKSDIKTDQDFFAMGGDSLSALNLILKLEKEFSVNLGVQDLVDQPTVEALTELIEKMLASGTVATSDASQMQQDIEDLVKELPTRFPSALQAAPKAVLLTGATGFVGSYLLAHFLEHQDSEIYALCRSGDPKRLQSVLMSKGLWHEDLRRRLHIVSGDLGEPGLGLSASDRDRILERCDAIVHCGAMVNFLYDYRAHKKANVDGTLELLKLASHSQGLSFHYISTLGVLNGEAAVQDKPVAEDVNVKAVATPDGGYSRSKLAAEYLVTEAKGRGLSTTIYRLGEIMPASGQGLPNPLALTHTLLFTLSRLRARPSAPIFSDWSPIDQVADQVIHGVRNPEHWNDTYHVFRPTPVSFTAVLTQAEMDLDEISNLDWVARLDAEITCNPSRHLLLIRSMLPATGTEEEMGLALNLLLVNNPKLFSCDHVKRLANHSHESPIASIRNYAGLLQDGDSVTALVAS